METGFYKISNEAYQKEEAVSKGDLTLFHRSPAHYKSKEYQKPTLALIFGAAVHTAILQPELYAKEYMCLPEGVDKRMKRGKELADEAEQNGQILLSWKDGGIIGEMKKAIKEHKTAFQLIHAEGPAEISGFWVDKRTSLECKCRPDKVRSDLNIVIDLKTAEDARFEAFQRSISNYKYHWQAAYYLDGVSEITGIQHTNFVFVVIEKEPPFAVAVYRIDDAAVYAGREEIKVLMNDFRECQEKDQWPAYLPDEIQAISLPQWYLRGANL